MLRKRSRATVRGIAQTKGGTTTKFQLGSRYDIRYELLAIFCTQKNHKSSSFTSCMSHLNIPGIGPFNSFQHHQKVIRELFLI